MNLVSFSIKTKGIRNFSRRLWTVFTRFGFSEARISRALHTLVETLGKYDAAPTFFIPAVVLQRHVALIHEITGAGAEMGVHGYIHNDYRYLSEVGQYKQMEQAVAVFESTHTPFNGFRNPYLGWTEDTLRVLTALGFAYESNEAVLHPVIDLDLLTPSLRSGYEKSFELFQALACNAYVLRPHVEESLLRIPTSIPDDEMLFDRLRITDAQEVGRIWRKIMERVYDLGGIYTLNLHPERALLCRRALDILLSFASSQALPVWLPRLNEVAQWHQERRQFKLEIVEESPRRWRFAATCSSRATLLARHLTLEDQAASPWFGPDVRVLEQSGVVSADRCPCIALSAQTPQEVLEFLQEQGYPALRCAPEEGQRYALYLDLPGGLGDTREEQRARRGSLLEQLVQLEAPLLYFGYWPDGCRAALAVSGDIDSITAQDFFLRVFEVSKHAD
ncbi:MAG TPA: polysaccharide deacetylase family protein [Ktedonobacteraceae bacterium]|nr:polysaccharide deacetylase family protein [Ktedonobacteraceae bacterium]